MIRVLKRVARASARSEESFIGVRFLKAACTRENSGASLQLSSLRNFKETSRRSNRTLDLPPTKSSRLDWLVMEGSVGFLISTASEGSSGDKEGEKKRKEKKGRRKMIFFKLREATHQ